MDTYFAKKDEIPKTWYIINAEDQVLGRLACKLANLLRGKNKPTFTPNVDTGDHVIVINASKIKMTGNKLQNKMYYRHSQYPGGLKSINAQDRQKKDPEGIIFDAVKGMLPKNKLSKVIISKMKIYPGSDHPHTAQNPVAYSG